MLEKEGEHNVMNLFRDVVGQSIPGMRADSFLEDEECARTALSCHLGDGSPLPGDASCLVVRGLPEGWELMCSSDCASAVPVSIFDEGGICPPDTWAAGVAPSLDSLALVVL